MDKHKILILLDDRFPYNKEGLHLEDEIFFLSNVFEHIYIFCNTKSDKIEFHLPENVTAFYIPIELNVFRKFRSILYIFTSFFFEENRFIKKTLKSDFSLIKIKFFLAEISKARILSNKINQKFRDKINIRNQIYIYSFWNNYNAIAAAFLKKRHPTIRSISRAHGGDVYFERNPENYLPGKSIMIKYLDAIYHVSENGLKYSQKKFGNIPNLKLSRMGSVNHIQPIINKPRDLFHIVSCSNLIPLKRIDLLIQALSIIKDDYKIKWTHIGEGYLLDILKIKARELLSEKKNISFCFLGFIPRTEVKEFYTKNIINLFINTSNTEGLPVTIMEAMSFAIPVLATNVGGNSEIVSNQINGTIISNNPDPEEIAEGILQYIQMEDTRYFSYCEAAYNNWNGRFNAENNYKEFTEMILSL